MPKKSDLIDPVEDCLVIGDRKVSVPGNAAVLVGVATGLDPLLLVPREVGVPRSLRPDRRGCSRSGERDFLRVSDDPVAQAR